MGEQIDEALLANLRDAGCDEALIAELEALPCGCARIGRLKEYRRELLGKVHSEQNKLECLDYLIYRLRDEYQMGPSPSRPSRKEHHDC